MQKIYFAGGCFWGVQGYFDLLKGVLSTQVGYANSKIPNPSYEMVCNGKTNAVEAIEIVYDEVQMPLCANDDNLMPECLLSRFFSIINPCAINQQGNDIGTQYRSGIYTQVQSGQSLLADINDFIARYVAVRYELPIATEIMMIQNFYPAESYHQKYLAKNPSGYCHIDISKALKPLT